MTRPIPPSDPWARPPREPEKKRRWPLIAGIGVAGVLGLSVVAGLSDGEPAPVVKTSPTSTTRVAGSSTITTTSATTVASVTTAPEALSLAPTTTVDVPVVPPVPTTTLAPPPPPPPAIVPVPTTTVDIPIPPSVQLPPPPAPAPAGAYYPNCKAAKAAGAAPLYRGDPGYSSDLDRDGDGVACEK